MAKGQNGVSLIYKTKKVTDKYPNIECHNIKSHFKK